MRLVLGLAVASLLLAGLLLQAGREEEPGQQAVSPTATGLLPVLIFHTPTPTPSPLSLLDPLPSFTRRVPSEPSYTIAEEALSVSPAPVAPTPKPPAPLPPPAPVVSADQMALAEMVCAAFPSDRRMCEHVVWAESLNVNYGGCTWRDFVYGPCWSPTNDCGLMQTNWPSHADKYAALGYGLEGCFIPEVNLLVSQQVYAEQGCYAWTSCWGR